MKLYYINDTMFQNTDFNRVIYHRFMKYYNEKNTIAIMISKSHKKQALYDQFLQVMKDTGIQIIQSPSCFDLKEVKGVLTNTSLTLDGFGIMHCYSGCCIEFDLLQQSYHRIYLEMFPAYENNSVDAIIKEIEQMIDKKLVPGKSKFTLN